MSVSHHPPDTCTFLDIKMSADEVEALIKSFYLWVLLPIL